MIAFLCVGMVSAYHHGNRRIWRHVPVTESGYVFGSLTALSGSLMLVFSVPILVNNFIMYYQHVQFALEEEKLKRNTSRKRTLMKRVEDIDKEISTKNNNSYC
jgi:hypothetical protein